jgi:hypothetical protein
MAIAGNRTWKKYLVFTDCGCQLDETNGVFWAISKSFETITKATSKQGKWMILGQHQ